MPAVKKYKSEKVAARSRRKVTIRKKISGTPERPRLSVFRSAKHIYVQAIDDSTNTVLAAASDLEESLKGDLAGKKKKDRAKAIGQAVAKRLLAKDIKLVVFDRNGFIYHGRVSAVADGAREAGLEF
jgi:large subunit ribosomal protein L18